MSQEDNADLWTRHMRSGDFATAWKVSDEVMKSRAGKPCWHLPRHYQYIWDGSSLAGKRVLVRCYHGLGDTIQFIRYAKLVKANAAALIVWAQAPLLPLLASIPEIDQLIALNDGAPEADFNVDVEIMELPHVFRTTEASIPAAIPYLFVDPIQLSPGPGKLSVGLVWKAGDWDGRRSIPYPYLSALGDVKGIELYVLQADAPAAGWQDDLGMYPGAFSLFDYARIIKGLDLLISVDSMPAHLAGALGVPVWTLLHAEADWRWMENRQDSPWYPTMRLFRQERADDWEAVIALVVVKLKEIAGLRSTSARQGMD